MNAAIYPGAFHATIPIPPDADIQARFQTWAALVAHPNLFNEFDALRTQARAAELFQISVRTVQRRWENALCTLRQALHGELPPV